MGDKKKDQEEKEKPKPIIVKNTTDLQRLKLEKLMKNPNKPIIIPERPKERGVPAVPDFVRNVMGSSAGAGSGEFHVYRHLRRKEYARQRFMKERGEKERLEQEYHDKIEKNKRLADDKTAKKRQKRLKRKQALKNKKPKVDNKSSESESSSESNSDSNADKAGDERSEDIDDKKGESVECDEKDDKNEETIN